MLICCFYDLSVLGKTLTRFLFDFRTFKFFQIIQFAIDSFLLSNNKPLPVTVRVGSSNKLMPSNLRLRPQS